MSRFSNKVVVITGAGSGIGADAARRFSLEGAAVVVSDVHGDRAAEVAADIVKRGGRAISLRTDVSCEAEVQSLVLQAVGEFGQIDVMFNNAGIGEQPVPIEELAIED